jgi:signal transduction histidine kinase
MQSRMRDGAVVALEVQDSGVGLDRQQLARVFEPFYSTKEGGLGMGLAISRSILTAHGGSLDAAPNEGAGVTFRCTLPVVGAVTQEQTS